MFDYHNRNRYVFFYVCCGIILFFISAVVLSNIIVASVMGNQEIATKFNFPRYLSKTELQDPPPLTGNLSYILIQTNEKEKGRNINWTEIRNNGPYECVVISDSFLGSKAGNYYLRRIAHKNNFTVLHIFTNHMEYCKNNPALMLVLLNNNGFFKDVGAKYIILGIAERSLARHLLKKEDLNMTKELPGIPRIKTQEGSNTSSNKSPVVIRCSPSFGVAGTTVDIYLEGSGFVPSADVILAPNTHPLIATNITVISDKKITCQFLLPPDYPANSYNVKVINPNKKSGARKVFSVTSHPFSHNEKGKDKKDNYRSAFTFPHTIFQKVNTSSDLISKGIDHFFTDASSNLTLIKTWIKNDILSLVGESTNDESLHFALLNESRFTNPLYESRLIYHYSDTSFREISMPDDLIQFDNKLDEIAHRLNNDNITFVFIPGVSAYTTYYTYIKDPPTARDPFFEIMRTLNRSYIFVDTKEIADEKQANGVPDLSGIGDPAHWTWRLTEGIPDPIDLFLASGEHTSVIPPNREAEYSNAVRAFREVIYERNCRDTWALNNDARLYLRANDTQKAITIFTRSLEIDPGQAEIKTLLRKLSS